MDLDPEIFEGFLNTAIGHFSTIWLTGPSLKNLIKLCKIFMIGESLNTEFLVEFWKLGGCGLRP